MRMQEKKNVPVHFMGFVVFLLLCMAPAFASAAVFQPCGEVYIRGILSSGSKVHVLCDRGICYEVDENNELHPCTLGCANQGIVSVITTVDGITYGMSRGNLYEWNPEGERVWEKIGTAPEMNYWAAGGNMLFGVGFEEETDRVVGYNMDDGKTTDIINFRQYSFQPVTITSDGLFVYPSRNSSSNMVDLMSVHPATKRTSVICSLRIGQVECLAADNENGYYLLLDRAIYYLSNEGKLSLVNYVPAHGSTERHLVVNQERGMIYFCGSTIDHESAMQALYGVPIEPDTEQKVLRIAGHYNYADVFGYLRGAILAFQSSHPEVQVVLLDEPTEFEDLSKALITGSDGFDIMALISLNGSLRTVLNKGYCADLSDMPGMTETMQSLYPIFREAVMRDDKVYAMPLLAYSEYCMGYNQELWKELELGEIPQTYDELFDLIEQWLTEDTLGTTPIFENYGALSMGRDTYLTLFYEVLEATAARYMVKGNTPVYHQEDLLHLLHRLEKLRPLIQAYEKQYHEGKGLLSRGHYDFICDETSEIHYLPLGFSDQEDRGVTIRLEAMAINPMSNQQELAKEFLSALMESARIQEQYTMYFKDEAYPGIEVQNYEKHVKEGEAWLAEAESQLEAAKMRKDDVVYYRGVVDDAKQYLEETINDRWVVTPEAAAYGRSQMPYVTLERENGALLIEKNASPQISSYQAGNITAEALCQRFDDIQRMWEMENK